MRIQVVTLLMGLPAIAGAQAAVEAAAGAGRAATGIAAPAQKVSKAISDAMEKLNRTCRRPTVPTAARK